MKRKQVAMFLMAMACTASTTLGSMQGLIKPVYADTASFFGIGDTVDADEDEDTQKKTETNVISTAGDTVNTNSASGASKISTSSGLVNSKSTKNVLLAAAAPTVLTEQISITNNDEKEGSASVYVSKDGGETAVKDAGTIAEGSVVIIRLTAADGYSVSSVKPSVIYTDGSETKNCDVTASGGSENVYRFSMPSSGVTIDLSGVFSANSYNIIRSNFADCNIELSDSEGTALSGTAKTGDTVTLKVTPKTGYQLTGNITFTDTNGNAVSTAKTVSADGSASFKFNMPAGDVTIDGKDAVTAKSYRLNVSKVENGTISVNGSEKSSSSDEVKYNSTVTLNIQPVLGYKVESITVTTDSGETVKGTDGAEIAVSESGSGTSFEFLMPDENVTVSASFAEADTASSVNVLNVAAYDKSQGTLTINGSEVSGGDTYRVPKGSEVSMAVTPNGGYRVKDIQVSTSSDFSTGNVDVDVRPSASGSAYTFTMPSDNASVYVKPEFEAVASEKTTSAVTVSSGLTNANVRIEVKEDSGNTTRTVNTAPGASVNFTVGTKINIKVEPEGGYSLEKITAAYGSGTEEATTGSLPLTIGKDDVTISADITEIPEDNTHNRITLSGLSGFGTASLNGGGKTITVTDGETDGTYLAGSTVKLRVYPGADYAQPSISLTDASGNSVMDADVKEESLSSYTEFSFTMPEKALNITVSFKDKHNVNVTSDGGTVTVNGSTGTVNEAGGISYEKIAPGEDVTVTATEDSTHIFSSLRVVADNVSYSSDGRTATFKMPESDVEIEALYKEARFITSSSEGSGQGSFTYKVNGNEVKDPGKLLAGDEIEIAAVPSDGSFFGNVATDYEAAAIKDGTVSFTMPDSNVDISAIFNQKETVTVTAAKEVISSYGDEIVNTDDDSGDGGVSYKSIPLEGAAYKVIADEDFYRNGTAVKAGDEIETLVTDENGSVTSTSDFTGKVHLINTSVPTDENLDTEEKEVSFTGGTGSAVYNYSADTINITAEFPDDSQNGQKVRLIAASDIEIKTVDNDPLEKIHKVIHKGDTIASATVTDEKAVFNAMPDTRYGSYAIVLTPAKGTFAATKNIIVPGNGQTKTDDGITVTVGIVNQETSISVYDDKGDNLSGAELEVLDASGRSIAAFTSDYESYTVKRMIPGTYTLHTVHTAPGYIKTGNGDITFTLDEEEQAKAVSLSEKKNTVNVSVTDSEDGAVTRDAVLNIFRIDDGVRTLVGTVGTNGDLDANGTINGLPAGTYVLSEKTTPNGYQKASDSSQFKVDEQTPEYTVTITSARTYGHVSLEVLSSVDRTPVNGAVYELSADDKVLATMTTDSTGKAKSSDLPIGTYEDGVYKGAITYKLQETKAPDDYVRDEEAYDIKFQYLNDSIPVVSITATLPNDPVNAAITSKTVRKKIRGTTTAAASAARSASNIQTGDVGTVAVYGPAGIAAAGAMIGAMISRKKKRHSNDGDQNQEG